MSVTTICLIRRFKGAGDYTPQPRILHIYFDYPKLPYENADYLIRPVFFRNSAVINGIANNTRTNNRTSAFPSPHLRHSPAPAPAPAPAFAPAPAPAFAGVTFFRRGDVLSQGFFLRGDVLAPAWRQTGGNDGFGVTVVCKTGCFDRRQ